jgi:hypothetical protein
MKSGMAHPSGRSRRRSGRRARSAPARRPRRRASRTRVLADVAVHQLHPAWSSADRRVTCRHALLGRSLGDNQQVRRRRVPEMIGPRRPAAVARLSSGATVIRRHGVREGVLAALPLHGARPPWGWHHDRGPLIVARLRPDVLVTFRGVASRCKRAGRGTIRIVLATRPVRAQAPRPGSIGLIGGQWNQVAYVSYGCRLSRIRRPVGGHNCEPRRFR